MADILEGLPVRTLNNGSTDPAEVTVGVLDSGGALITPSKDATVAAVTAAINTQVDTKTSALNTSLGAINTTLGAQIDTKTSVLNTSIAAVGTDINTQIDTKTSVLNTSIGAITTKLGDASQKSQIVSGSGTVLVIDAQGTAAVLLKDSAGATLIGQKAMAASLPVVLPSDQTVNVNVISSVATAPVDDYNTASAVAAGGTSTHTYTSVATNNLILQAIHGTSSGLLKIEVKIGPAGSEVSKAVGFNSTANPNIDIPFWGVKVPAGQNVLVIRTNRESAKAQDLYSTVFGENV